MKVDHNQFLPTLFFGFQLVKGKEVLCQMWVNAINESEWRKVPMVEMKDERKPSIAGYLDDEDD